MLGVLFLLGFTLVPALVLSWAAWYQFAPYRWFRRGEYEKARRHWEGGIAWTSTEWARNTLRIRAIECLRTEGRLSEALAFEEKLLRGKLSRLQRERLLIGHLLTLLLLGHDGEALAPTAMEVERGKLLPPRWRRLVPLLLAHTELSAGRSLGARSLTALIPSGSASRPGAAPARAADLEQEAAAMLRGWLLVRMGENERAVPDLRLAAGAVVPHVFRAGAAVLLRQHAPAETCAQETPPSLAPHVLSRDQAPRS